MTSKIIEDNISDLVADFLYYDRKEDEDLPNGQIEEDIASGETSVNEIVELFRHKLEEGIGQ